MKERDNRTFPVGARHAVPLRGRLALGVVSWYPGEFRSIPTGIGLGFLHRRRPDQVGQPFLFRQNVRRLHRVGQLGQQGQGSILQ